MSFVHVDQQQSSAGGVGGGGGSAERTLFVGHKIPLEIKKMTTLLSSLDKPAFRLILTATTAALEGKELNMKELLSKVSSPKLTEESVCFIISGLYRLLQLALRSSQSSLKSEMLGEDLKELKIPDEFTADIISVVFGQRRPSLLKHALESGVHLNKLESLKWRVDVGISTSVLNRLLEPSVSMEMVLSNGSIHHLEIPMHKFHELRYNVAHVLKEIEVLEKRSILKIQD